MKKVLFFLAALCLVAGIFLLLTSCATAPKGRETRIMEQLCGMTHMPYATKPDFVPVGRDPDEDVAATVRAHFLEKARSVSETGFQRLQPACFVDVREKACVCYPDPTAFMSSNRDVAVSEGTPTDLLVTLANGERIPFPSPKFVATGGE